MHLEFSKIIPVLPRSSGYTVYSIRLGNDQGIDVIVVELNEATRLKNFEKRYEFLMDLASRGAPESIIKPKCKLPASKKHLPDFHIFDRFDRLFNDPNPKSTYSHLKKLFGDLVSGLSFLNDNYVIYMELNDSNFVIDGSKGKLFYLSPGIQKGFNHNHTLRDSFENLYVCLTVALKKCGLPVTRELTRLSAVSKSSDLRFLLPRILKNFHKHPMYHNVNEKLFSISETWCVLKSQFNSKPANIDKFRKVLEMVLQAQGNERIDWKTRVLKSKLRPIYNQHVEIDKKSYSDDSIGFFCMARNSVEHYTEHQDIYDPVNVYEGIEYVWPGFTDSIFYASSIISNVISNPGGYILEIAIQAAANVVINMKDYLNEWDKRVGGGCGSGMFRGALAILKDVKKYYPLDDPANTIKEIRSSLRKVMLCTSSGIIYDKFFEAAWTRLKENSDSEITALVWADALEAAITAVRTCGDANAIPLLNALNPASRELKKGLVRGDDAAAAAAAAADADADADADDADVEVFVASSRAAVEAARSTKTMQAQAGGSSYASAVIRASVPEPGAMVAACWYQAAALAIKERK